MPQTAQYGGRTYAGGTYGESPTGYAGVEAPWHIGAVRVDGLRTDGNLSPVVPGEAVSYDCVFLPQPSNGDQNDDHVERYKDLREYLVRGPDVITYDPPGARVFYREQHDGASQLVRIAPLRADHDATYENGNPPPGRDSIHNGRWAVITGGEAHAPLPDRECRLVLETVTIASTAEYPTREAVVDAAERNDI